MPLPRLCVPRLGSILLIVAAGTVDEIQGQKSPAETTSATARLRARAPALRITDDRLGLALERLIAASPSARGALKALSRGGLPVAIGSPSQLTVLLDSAGSLAEEERRALLGATLLANSDEVPVAWVVFRTSGDAPSRGRWIGGRKVERVWIAIEVDSVEAWIRNAYPHNPEALIEQDLLAILAHEFVAHVGSIAATRRMKDFCDDPTADQRRERARTLAWGQPPPLDDESSACSLRVENQVRRELNRTLKLRGDRALPMRRSYTLDLMHFAQARRAEAPALAQVR